ncbi:MAG: sensor histidine kinase [Candidatus Borkfalkia sp.]
MRTASWKYSYSTAWKTAWSFSAIQRRDLINRTAAKLLEYEENEPVRLFVEDAEVSAALAGNETASVSHKFGEREYMLRFTKVEETRVLLMTDVTEAVSAARSKNEFIANVTHEMNTPLTSIKGFAELIGSGNLDNERVSEAAATILRQSERLSNLIRSIINFSAIDNDELPPYDVDLTALVKETAAPFGPRIAERNISFTLEAEEGVIILSRRERMIEILNNLISNGIRYNKDGGDLKITLTGGKIPELCVSDTGVGISEENLPHIFSRFYTVDKSHNGTGGGFGLGLAIVRKLCTRAGWKLSVESRLGEGTTFKIRFFPPKIL